MTRSRLPVPLFAGSIFASAFLVFLVQPMVGKRIVPWFGGAPAVWSLCLAFYQTTLFAGYAYAHCLIRYTTPRLQFFVHAIVLAVALLALPVLPGELWKPEGAVDPSASILAMLAASVAPPFLALAATGPLVQAWFARGFPARSPYPLYAVSNLGSLLALLAYPFLLEPHLALSATGRLWSLAFAITGAAVLACAALAWRAGGASASVPQTEAAIPPPSAQLARSEASRPARSEAQPSEDRTGLPSDDQRTRRVLWVLLAGCAVVLLMGVTNELCLDTASVPFLWILPLGIYLISFILCFGSERTYRRTVYVWVSGLALVMPDVFRLLQGAGVDVSALWSSIVFQVARYCALLFGACMVLHGELHRLRPSAPSLTAFYLAVSGGGALGGIFVGIVAPRVFDDYHELPLGLALAWLLLIAACWDDSRSWLRRAAPPWRWVVAALSVVGLAFGGSRVFGNSDPLLYQERTFFGVLRVREITDRANSRRALLHGTTLHGVQILDLQRPTAYYGLQTGIGIALGQREPDTRSEVGVIGLGTGTLAAYGRPGDHFRFFEIDPAVIRLSKDAKYFSYLDRSAAEIEIIDGDGRISLASERARNAPLFDFLIVDAYSSDAVPVHLLTREALALYVDSLNETGMLAIHVSSRHFDLMPIVARVGEDLGLEIVSIQNPALPRHMSGASRWVFLSRDKERIQSLARAAAQRRRSLGLLPDPRAIQRPSAAELARAPLWTDDYSDLFGALRFSRGSGLEPWRSNSGGER